MRSLCSRQPLCRKPLVKSLLQCCSLRIESQLGFSKGLAMQNLNVSLRKGTSVLCLRLLSQGAVGFLSLSERLSNIWSSCQVRQVVARVELGWIHSGPSEILVDLGKRDFADGFVTQLHSVVRINTCKSLERTRLNGVLALRLSHAHFASPQQGPGSQNL